MLATKEEIIVLHESGRTSQCEDIRGTPIVIIEQQLRAERIEIQSAQLEENIRAVL